MATMLTRATLRAILSEEVKFIAETMTDDERDIEAEKAVSQIEKKQATAENLVDEIISYLSLIPDSFFSQGGTIHANVPAPTTVTYAGNTYVSKERLVLLFASVSDSIRTSLHTEMDRIGFSTTQRLDQEEPDEVPNPPTGEDSPGLTNP